MSLSLLILQRKGRRNWVWFDGGDAEAIWADGVATFGFGVALFGIT